MLRGLRRLVSAFVLVVLSCAIAFAQSTVRSSLSGAVSDSNGGVVPGATVVVTNTATGVSSTTVTNSTGAFSVPSLDPGTYSVTVSLSGFKTVVIKEVVLVAGAPGSVTAKLEIGNLTETVEVKAATEIVQTQSTAISSTINATQIQNLPLTSRNALFGFVPMLPGVDTLAAPRDSTLFGLPESSINITIDGINTQNNFQRDTDGFYSMVFPQLDAVEQVTLTGAAAGAESASGGSVAIRFVTRSGSNQYKGTAYYYFRHPDFNTNYYFNEVAGLPKNRIILNQFGGSAGGPIKVKGLFDGTGRAFFFFNYEEFYQPTSATRTRVMMHPNVQNGIFRYNVTSGGVTTVREVDLMKLAADNGQTATFDPTVAAILAQIRAGANTSVADGTGVITDTTNVLQQQFRYLAPGKYYNHLPTTRVDFNLSSRHRLSGSYWWQEINRYPDIQNGGESTFPDLPNVANYTSTRTVGSVTLRSSLSSNFVNELVGGWQWSPGTFNSGVVGSMFDNQDGFNLNFPAANNQPIFSTGPTRSTNPNTRHQTNWNINDTVNWLRGSHSMSFGGGFSRVGQWNDSLVVVPSITFGVQSGVDPADAMFNTTNFPNASGGNLTNARQLYALLTGRVTSLNGTATLDENTNRYAYLGPENVRASMDEYSLFFQDSWRLRRTVTLNYGLGWVVQQPLAAGNGIFSTTDYAGFCGPYGTDANGRCKLFHVGGEQTGVVPMFVQYTADSKGYKTDWNNVAPNVGVAWLPDVQSGWLRTILGDPEQATLRAGYSTTFDKPSMGEFFDVYGGNPGRTYNANRNNNTGSNHLLVQPGEPWPVLFRDKSRLGPPTGIPDGPAYPIAATTGSSLAIFDSAIEVPYAHSFSVGLQRAVSRDMAVEVRYVGTRGRQAWVTENWNETNVIENGFLDEFKLAQKNLLSAVDAGLCATAATCSFAYRGPGTGTYPLPIYLAYLTGTPTSQAADPTKYTASLFTNTTFLGRLGRFEPEVINAAEDDLQTTARIANALAAGLPSNFFRMNPAIGTNDADFTTSVGESRYDSIVVELRRRMSRGLQVQASYTKAWRWGQFRDTLHNPRGWVRSTGEVPWAVKLTTNYDIPVGQGRRFATDANAWLNGVVGGWSTNWTVRVQSGRVLTVTGARLVGMTEQELQDMYKLRIVRDADVTTVYMLPDDVILNTRRAYDSSATSVSGYGSLGPPEGKYIAPASSPDCVQLYPGDCAPRNIFLTGPMFTRVDMSAKKLFPIGRRVTFTLEVDVLNVFDAINFNPVFNPGSGGTIFQVTSAYTDISGTYDPGGRLAQVVWRLNW